MASLVLEQDESVQRIEQSAEATKTDVEQGWVTLYFLMNLG